jgi:hypothetical protein
MGGFDLYAAMLAFLLIALVTALTLAISTALAIRRARWLNSDDPAAIAAQTPPGVMYDPETRTFYPDDPNELPWRRGEWVVR